MKNLDYFAIHALLNTLAGLFCAAMVFFQNPQNRKNQFFALHCFALGVVYYLTFRWRLSTGPEEGLFYFRLLMLPTIWLPVTDLHHTLLMFDLLTKFRKRILVASYFGSAILTFFIFTPLFIRGVHHILTFDFWAIPGPFFFLFQVIFLIGFNYSLVLLWKYRSQSSPVHRNMMAWLILAKIFGYGGSGSNWPLYFNIPIPPLLNITMFFYLLIISFLYFKLGLLDMKLFFRDTTVHLITTIFIGGACSLFAMPFVKDTTTIFWIFAVAALVPFAYRSVFVGIRELINKTKLGQSTQYLKTVDTTMARIKESTYTYDDLARNIVKSVQKTFPIDLAAVYFYDLSRKEFHLRAQTGMKNPLVRDLRFN